MIMTIKMMSSYYHELMGKIEKYEGVGGGGYLMNNDYILDGVIDKIKLIIATEKFDDDKILTKAGKKFTDEITIKNVVILIACVIKDGDKCYPQLFSKEALVAYWWEVVQCWREVLTVSESSIKVNRSC